MSSEYILIVDDSNQLEKTAAQALGQSSISVRAVKDLILAKRTLVQSTPIVILSSADLGESSFQFCKELQAHPVLASVPVLLFSKDVNAEKQTKAKDSGASEIMSIASSADSLRQSLSNFIPELGSEAPEQKSQKQAPAKPSQSTPNSNQHKLQTAQQLLAKVLHNLKTSHLLETAEIDDIPNIVLEITKALCNPPKTGKNSPQNELDLNKAFGLKK